MNAPKTATHYLPRPDGQPQMWYRVGTVKVNTGEVLPTLEYLSYCDIWQGTNASNHEDVLAKLVKIEDKAK